ncbi:MAG: glycosyltransferase [Vicinamibacterales bacterium]|nr:glycosyltransferase [Vicinamibacterales bacterium]
MRVALIHDWLTGMRGGEKALEDLCALFPEAELFTLVHRPGSTSALIEGRPVHRSPIQALPLSLSHYRHYLPLFPTAVEFFDLDRFDLVVSCSHCVAKSVVVPPRARHLCYCLTPMRYAWDQFDAYFGPDRVGAVGSALLRPVLGHLARWDRATAGRVHRYLAISQYVARRIRLYYNRESTVVYPPVDTEFYTPADTAAGATPPGTGGYLVVSALVPYKRIDLAIGAAHRAGVPLTIVGDGPERPRLEALATGVPGITFTGRLPDVDLRARYQAATALLFPGEEDFGIVPLEAQAMGCPVVALGRGGALETVVDGETGLLFDAPTEPAMAEALTRATTVAWDRARIRAHAERFGRTRFLTEMTTIVDETLRAPGTERW